MKRTHSTLDNIFRGNKGKKWSFAFIAVFCLAFIGCLIIYLYNNNLNFNKPLLLDDYLAENSEWSFYVVEDGRQQYIQPNSVNGKAVLSSDSEVYCERIINEELDGALLDLNRVEYPAAVYLDNELLYANTELALDENGVTLSENALLSSTETMITLPDNYVGKTLTVIFSPSGGEVELPRISLANSKTIFGAESTNVIGGVVRAVYSMVFAIFTLCVFLAGIMRGKTDIAMLVLAVYSSVYVFLPLNVDYIAIDGQLAQVFRSYHISDFLSVFATGVMLIFLTLKARNNTKPLVVVSAVYAGVVLISYIFACFVGSEAIEKVISVCHIIYYAQLMMVFIIAFIEWKNGSFFYKYFFMLELAGIVGFCLWGIYCGAVDSSFVLDDFLVQSKENFFQPYLSSCIIIVALVEFVVDTATAAADYQHMAVQNQLTREYITNLSKTIDEVRRTRHELRHHLETMSIMSKNGLYDRLDGYIEKVNNEVNIKPRGMIYYSENTMVSAIVSSKLCTVGENGIETDVSINLPKTLNVNTVAFSSFLMNMLENAMEACERLPQGEKRWIKLRMKLKSGKIIIGCQNSASDNLRRQGEGFVTEKTDAPESHGFGIGVMYRCCDAVGGSMVIERGDKSFIVRAVFPLEKET